MSITSKTLDKQKYSKVQYFFWLLSGAEISILKDCPTDYNRQAGIGFTIFMTTLLAFFSGSYAGYYFGQSYFTGLLFGIIWASLIFSIDRSMVVTLKKNPTIEKQKFWAPFLSRAVLAILIAFIISIPLEILVFQDSIAVHKEKFKQNKTLGIIYGQSTIEDIDSKKEVSINLETGISSLETELLAGEPKNDAQYDELKRDFKNADSKYNNLKQKFNSINTTTINAYNNNEPERYKRLTIIRSNARSEMRTFANQEYFPKKLKFENYLSQWKKDKKDNISALDVENKQVKDKIKISSEKVSVAGNKMDSILYMHDNSFIFNFMVLEDLARTHKKILKQSSISNIQKIDTTKAAIDTTKSPSKSLTQNNKSFKQEWVEEYDSEGANILFLLWLIRILFFTIEILPTIAKIATPLGAYDFAVHKKEKDLEAELEEKTLEYLAHQKALRKLENDAEIKQLKDRTRIENKLHEDLITEIASVQDEVARKKIAEFKSKHL